MADVEKLCLPITDLDSVLNWTPPASSWSDYVIAKTKRSTFCNRGASLINISNELLPVETCPKTLLCHDMKGGYLEDKYVDGSEKHDEFRFVHWSCIDTFVYFSHNFVTIPPLSWINSAHLHGVTVLGTLISEWKDGEEMWKQILSDPAKLMNLCEKLCAICIHYNFDGYLFNVENDIRPEHVFALLDFVSILRSTLLSMKSDAVVIWYDSVTLPAGNVKYQNKLNGYNRGFFENCDGIFLNYNWTSDDLKLSATNAGKRLTDVYVGVDVFGRGCYGGGGFNSNLAVEMAHMHSLSVALFAPGWVHETCQEGESFETRNYKFWSLLHPILYTRGPANLPFSTTFCQGYGEKMYSRGIVVSETSWYNLSRQSYQPTDMIGPSNGEVQCCISHYNKRAFQGGGCLLVRKCHSHRSDETSLRIHRLFICELKPPADHNVCVSITTSPLDSTKKSDLCLVLALRGSDGQLMRKVLCSRDMQDINEITDYEFPCRVLELFENRLSPWVTWDFEFSILNATIVGIGCALVGEDSPVLFGQLTVDSTPITNRAR